MGEGGIIGVRGATEVRGVAGVGVGVVGDSDGDWATSATREVGVGVEDSRPVLSSDEDRGDGEIGEFKEVLPLN
jgi:hypothetical protein